MTHLVLRAAAVLVAVGTSVSPRPALAQEPRIVIRMYDVATTDPVLRAEAMDTASAIVSHAGVSVHWTDCSRGGADHPCRTVPGARELVVRIVPETGANHSRAALSIRGLSGSPDRQLGFAAVGGESRSGILATVYYETVSAIARSSGLVTSQLLGRAIAHEVGHLLLPGAGHSPSGLMRAPWAYEELMENRREDWVFSPQDRRQLRSALTR
jgi:hypothetical protein